MDLPEKMVMIADRDSLAVDHPMRLLAKQLDDQLTASDFSTKKMVGAWARARRVYCDYTGEPLV